MQMHFLCDNYFKNLARAKIFLISIKNNIGNIVVATRDNRCSNCKNKISATKKFLENEKQEIS